MMNDPVAQPLFAVPDVPHSTCNGFEAGPSSASSISSEFGPLCLVDEASPYLVVRGDIGISDDPLMPFLEIG
jgi:hypothetical protein